MLISSPEYAHGVPVIAGNPELADRLRSCLESLRVAAEQYRLRRAEMEGRADASRL